jgi:hypothetical protein
MGAARSPSSDAAGEWATRAALRLLRAASGPDLLAETHAVILEATTAATKKRRGERMASLLIALSAIAGDSAAQFAKTKGGTFEEYVDELERDLHGAAVEAR